MKHIKNFTSKLSKSDRLNVKSISLHLDKEKAAAHKPTSHINTFDVPFHLGQAFELDLFNMIEAGIVEQCKVPTQ